MHDLHLLTNITVALVTAFAGGLLARRLGLPTIVGYLLARMAIGPFTHGVTNRSASRNGPASRATNGSHNNDNDARRGAITLPPRRPPGSRQPHPAPSLGVFDAQLGWLAVELEVRHDPRRAEPLEQRREGRAGCAKKGS